MAAFLLPAIQTQLIDGLRAILETETTGSRDQDRVMSTVVEWRNTNLMMDRVGVTVEQVSRCG